jgi:hypothetical protein
VKLCDNHADALRSALVQRGLGGLFAATGDEAETKTIGMVQFGVTIDTFEPLISAQIDLIRVTVNHLGLVLCRPQPGGPPEGPCPVCLMTETHSTFCTVTDCDVVTFDHWIYHAADDQLARWRELRP